jgi:alpha-L-arabinofuranosidase
MPRSGSRRLFAALSVVSLLPALAAIDQAPAAAAPAAAAPPAAAVPALAAPALAAPAAAAPAAAAPAAAAPALVGHWTMDEGAGGTAADSAGTHPATLRGAATWGAGVQGKAALVTDGASGFADAGPGVIDTAQSFSINAWVKLDRIGGYQTVVSVDGSQVSGFFFGLRDDTRRFAFVKLPADQAAGAPAFPSSTFDPVAGQWYQLTGVHDADAGTLALYVNGRLEATTPAPAKWTAAGSLVIGRGRFGGNPVDFVDGTIDDVRVYTGVLPAPEVARLASQGSWRFDEGSGTTAADDSTAAQPATLTAGASWTTGVVGQHAALFDGGTGAAEVPNPVVDTSQSFSVAAWVRPDVATGFRTAVSVDGDQVSGFFLQRRDDGRFAFTRLVTDAPGAGTFAASSAVAEVGQWVHLVGVYDRVAGTLTLYVNGTRQQSVAFTTPWRAGGHLAVGRGKYAGAATDFFAGAVDDVRTFPFPLDPARAASLAGSGSWHFDEGAGGTAADASPNEAAATLRGAGWAPGAAGTALALDGTADAQVADVPGLNLGTSSATLTAWFKTAGGGEQPVLAKGTAAPADPGYRLGLNGGAVTARIGGGPGRIEVATTATGYADGAFHHAAAVLDRRTQRFTLYVDGELAAIAPVAGACGTPAGPTAVVVADCKTASADAGTPLTIGSAATAGAPTTGSAGSGRSAAGAATARSAVAPPAARRRTAARPRAGSAGGTRTAGRPAAPAIGTTYLTGAVDEVQVTRFALGPDRVAALAGANTLAVDATDIRATTRSTTYGAFLEDISHSGDGGLYAELVRNRTFKEPFQGGGVGGPVPYWALSTAGGGAGSFAIDPAKPLNAAIDRSLRVHLDGIPAGGRVAVANSGYYGVAVAAATTYKGSLWASGAGFTGRARVSLEKPDGTVLASTVLGPLAGPWARYPYTLRTPAGIAATTDNRIVVALEPTCAAARCAVGGSDVWLSTVSLFPPTYRNRPNGLRADLATMIADMRPGFFRVPGGNYLEGSTLATRFDWKATLGPIEARPGHQNTAWGYWSTDGLGLLEYLRMAEDVGAQPILALYAGYALNGTHVPPDQFGPVVQDALDEIQYAIGGTDTPWGARRAADGHPAPFVLNYVEVGNEDWFDQSGSYEWRFTEMYDAIRAAYPQLKIIATTGGYQGGAASTTPTGRTPDLVDDHYYNPPSWFAGNSHRYDTVDRGGPQVLVGEYGALDGSPTGTLRAAVGEAAFLTGLERNSDIVIGSTYAPIIVNENAGNWPTNLIGIDADSAYGSPSYWVQRTFSTNLGRQVVGTRLGGAGGLAQVVTKTTQGGRTTFYVKIVNSGQQLQSARISFSGVTQIDGTATRTELTGDPSARNTLADPTAVAPSTRELTGVTASTRFTFPPYSVTVLRITGR